MAQYRYFHNDQLKVDPTTGTRCRTGQLNHQFVEQKFVGGAWVGIGDNDGVRYGDVAGAGCRFREGMTDDGDYAVDVELEVAGFLLAEDGWVNCGSVEGYFMPSKLSSKIIGWFKESEEVGGVQPNRMDGGATVLTVVSGTGLNKVYQLPAGWVAYDTDYAWWKTDGSLSVTDGNRLIAYDFARTIVKYDSIAPYTLREIVILSDDLTDAEKISITKYMKLSPFTFNEWIEGGEIKENRAFEYTPWLGDLDAPTGLTLALIAGGVRVSFTDNSGGTAQHEIWGKIDAGAYALITTLDAVDVSYDDLRTPEDLMTYKVRAVRGTQTTNYIEDDIAMLGANLVPSASSDFATDGSAWWTALGTKTWNSGTHDLIVTQAGTGRNYIYRTGLVTAGVIYLVRFDIKGDDVGVKMEVANFGGAFLTDLLNLTISANYQTFKFKGSVNTTLLGMERLGEAAVTNKYFTIDNIKIQEVL